MDIMDYLRKVWRRPSDKISAIEKYLADYKHEVEMRGGIDGARGGRHTCRATREAPCLKARLRRKW